jgi:hypothetical protein
MRFLFVILLGLVESSFVQRDEIIIWSKNRPLTWDDFKGKIKKRNAVASTHYMLKRYVVSGNNSTEIHIEACFFCNTSWKRKPWIDNSILKHEQKHFDIVELFARKLRKKISELTIKNKNDATLKLDSLYEIYNKSMDIYQDKYDDESDNSMNHDSQILWESKISLGLDSFSKYQNTTIFFNKN